MCYWVGTRKVREELLKKRKEKPEDEIAQLFYKSFIAPDGAESLVKFQAHNVAIGKAKPLLTSLIKRDNELSFQNFEWTLQWNYFDRKVQQDKTGRPLLNVTSENIFWQHKELVYSQRCVVPIDGYWEFYHFNGKTYPYFLHSSKGSLLYVGGIYNQMVDTATGEVSESMALITTPPNDIAKKLHNNPKAPNGSRMLLLLEYSEIMNFLNSSLSKYDLQNKYLKPYASQNMEAHTTVRFLKKENSDYLLSGKVQEPFEYSELVG